MSLINMKDKKLSRIRLNSSGKMVMEAVQAAADAPSKGLSAQPGGPNTAEEEANIQQPEIPTSLTEAAPHEKHPGVASDKVLQTETAADAEIAKHEADASESVGGDQAPVITATEEEM